MTEHYERTDHFSEAYQRFSSQIYPFLFVDEKKRKYR